MATKAILVNAQALDRKYGSRSGEVWGAANDMIAADGARGIQTGLVKLDDPTGPAGEAAIATDDGWIAVKYAVDAVVQALAPDYLMLLGGPDLLPHCELDNPTQDDEDSTVPSDLPFACDAPASSAAADFVAPTRVLSRLPDVPAATAPDVLLQILAHASNWKSRNRDTYNQYLGITAEVWEGSTELTLAQLYGNPGEMQISPPSGPSWSAAILDRPSHFANLHGAPSSTQYFGQRGSAFPVAHDAALVDGRVSNGTVAVVEACYGAELFEPTEGQLPIPLAYLRSGAYGFFGSTTIAWGPSIGNDWADVICRLFQASILEGASIGRAGLEARQEYVAQSAPLDPIDLKTLAQFLVLGDPSAQPVARSGQTATSAADREAERHQRSTRQKHLRVIGEALSRVETWTRPLETEPDDRVLAMLRELAAVPSAGEPKVRTFGLSGGGAFHGVRAFAAKSPRTPATMYLLMQEVELEEAPMRQRIAVVAVEEDDRITSVKTGATR